MGLMLPPLLFTTHTMIIFSIFLSAFLSIGSSHISSSEIYTHYCTPEGACYPIWSNTRNCSSSRHFYVFPLLQVIPESLKTQYFAVIQRHQISFEVQFFDNRFIQSVAKEISKIEGRVIESSQVHILPLSGLRLVWANDDPEVESLWLPRSPKPQIILREIATFSVFAHDRWVANDLLKAINGTAGFLESTLEIQYTEDETSKRAPLQMRRKETNSCEGEFSRSESEAKPPRHKHKSRPKMMLISGRFSNSTEIYVPSDPTQNRKLTDLNFVREGLVGALFDEKIYVAGGILDETKKKFINVQRYIRHDITTEIYDFNTKQWEMGPNMISPHTWGSACVLDDRLIVCGGVSAGHFGRSQKTNQCEFLRSNETEWKLMTSMPKNTSLHSCAVIDNKLYIIGGAFSENELKLVQIYSPDSDLWSYGGQLTKPRVEAAAAVFDNEIIVCGGWNSIVHPAKRHQTKTTRQRDCEKYDRAANRWRHMDAEMNERREAFVLLPFQNELYAFGGRNGDQQLQHVEILNPKNDTWNFSNTQTIVGRSSFVGVVVE